MRRGDIQVGEFDTQGGQNHYLDTHTGWDRKKSWDGLTWGGTNTRLGGDGQTNAFSRVSWTSTQVLLSKY